MGCGGCAPKTLSPGNDQTLVVQGVVAQQTGLPIPGAVVSATLTDPNGDDVPGLTNLEMNETGSPFAGDYAAAIDGSQFNPPDGSGYLLTILVTSPGRLKLTFPVLIADRTQ